MDLLSVSPKTPEYIFLPISSFFFSFLQPWSWICRFELSKSDNEFIISDSKNPWVHFFTNTIVLFFIFATVILNPLFWNMKIWWQIHYQRIQKLLSTYFYRYRHAFSFLRLLSIIGHFELWKSDNEFVISDPKNSKTFTWAVILIFRYSKGWKLSQIFVLFRKQSWFAPV